MINQDCARSANLYGKLIKSKLQTFIIIEEKFTACPSK